MQRKEKIGIGIAMSMGLFAACTAFVKCSMIPEMRSDDFSFQAYRLIIWGAAEVATTICAASIPQLRVLFREVVITHHRRHEDNSSHHDGHHLQEHPQQQHHMIREKAPTEFTTRDSSFGSASGTGTGSGSGSGAGAGEQQGAETNTPAPASSIMTLQIQQPLRPSTTAIIQVTPGSFGFAPTCTTAVATADNNTCTRSNNSSLSSYTGVLRGVRKSKSKKREREAQEWEELDTGGHGCLPHTNDDNLNQPWRRAMRMGGILQTQEVKVQVHDRDADLDESKIGYAV